MVDSTPVSTDTVIYMMAGSQSVFSILVAEFRLYDEYTSGVRFHPDGVGEVSFNQLPEVTAITIFRYRSGRRRPLFTDCP